MNGQKLNRIRRRAGEDAKKLHKFSKTLSELCDFSHKKVTYDEILIAFGGMSVERQVVLRQMPKIASAINGIYCDSIYSLYEIVDASRRKNKVKDEKKDEKIEYLISLLIHEWCNIMYDQYKKK